MDYQYHYDILISRARNRLLEGYAEKHHIIPVCMNGSNDIKNIIALTPEEHYVAHQLLVKIYPNNKKLVFAAHMMTVGAPNQCRNNKLYGWLRRRYSEAHKGKIISEEHKRKIGKFSKGKTYEEIYGIKGAKIQKEKRSKPLIGKPSGMLGKTHNESTRCQQSKAHKGEKNPMYDKAPWNKGKKGLQIAWNKGISPSEETRQRQSVSQKRRREKERNE